jgi:SAM-dependent methyltransferase
MADSLDRSVRRFFYRWRWCQSLVFWTMDLIYQCVLLPFRRRSRTGSIEENAELVDGTDRFNLAAESYFARFANREFLTRKPFSDTADFAKHLVETGLLIEIMHLKPGDTVAEIGAGSCWLSHMMNRFGCHTISIDVSPTALEIGRSLFDRDSWTDWSLEPRFATYDGHVLPLPDSCCDRVVVKDAFHHVPNQGELLREVWRVLRSDGVLVMSEPGRGHASTAPSRAEGESGVLENELVLEDLAALARYCGFRETNVVIATSGAWHEIPADTLGAFTGGRGFARFWKRMCSDLRSHHFLAFYKGSSIRTTQRPGVLSADIRLIGLGSSPDAVVRAGQSIQVRVTNRGDTVWMAQRSPRGGWTRLGAHLYKDTAAREPLDYDWLRMELPCDIEAGSHADLTVKLPRLDAAGSYCVIFDMVVEGYAWFAERGSKTAVIRVTD